MQAIKQYKISISILTVITGVFLLISCTQRIDIHTDDAAERLVIYGYITSDTKQHAIRITRSSGYFATTPPEGISEADVMIISESQTLQLKESSSQKGLYLTENTARGIEGENYRLLVMLDFDNDGIMEEFEAESYLPYAPLLDSIDFKESTLFDNVIEVQIYGKAPYNDENHFSFHISRNDEILNDSLDGFFIISDEYLSQNEFNGLSCFYLDQDEDDGKLEPGDLVTVRIDALTKEYADFLDNAKSEAGGSIPIFSGPPANVQTNIRSIRNPDNIPISGFFSAFAGATAYKKYP